MVYSYVTFSKEDEWFNIVFENNMELNCFLKVLFKPINSNMIFGKDRVDLNRIKLRDPEVILAMLEEYGLTYITEGLS